MSLQELSTKFEAVKAQMMAEATTAIHAEFKKVFDTYPELTVVRWNQYQNYFNDGDECTFDVHDFVISNAPDIENVSIYGEYDGSAEDVFVHEGYYGVKNTYAKVWEIHAFAKTSIGEDVFKGAFGDHVTVIVTRDGIDTEHCEHD